MTVLRVEKNKGYTVISNHHLRDKSLTLKAKGLLPQMLSLPEGWDYTLKGLFHISREGIDVIKTAVWEPERAGYIRREQGRDTKGKMADMVYITYEQPVLEDPVSENPTSDNPVLEDPISDNPVLENPAQLNKEVQRTDLSRKGKIITDGQSTHSIPIPFPTPTLMEDETVAALPEWKRTRKDEAVRTYRGIILENTEHTYLIQDRSTDYGQFDGAVDPMLGTVRAARKTIRVAGDDYSAKLMKPKYVKLTGKHTRLVLDCLRENTMKVRNIEQCLRVMLFNALNTTSNYYTALTIYDMV